MRADREDFVAVSINQNRTAFTSLQSPSKAPSVVEPLVPSRVNRLVYSSVALIFLQATYFGWSLSQLNFSKFNNRRNCDARPVASGTCLMFPGHSSSDWLFVVNGWVVGGMAGAFSCGYFADRYGRKSTLTANCFVIIIAAVVQAIAPTLPVFVVGRVIAGIASGTATAICNGYVSEVTPPHLRGTVGTFFVFAIALDLFLVSIAFFIAGTSSGWRYIAGFPVVLALIILVFSRQHLVESPAWLFLQQRDTEAEDVLSQLYGEENVIVAIQWTKTNVTSADKHKVSWKSLFAVRYRRQLILALHFALSAQFTGINAVFFYSSILFKTAGIKDGRFGNLVVSLLYLLPSFVVPFTVRRFGNRKMLIGGHFAMLLAAVGLTIALVSEAETLSIKFVALYAAIFSLTLCALMFPTAATIFPDDIRAIGMSLVMLVNWIGTLIIGVGYPYVASALNDLAFLPFIVSLIYFVIFMYKFLPNTTGKTNDEIQQFFDKESNIVLCRVFVPPIWSTDRTDRSDQ